MEKEKVSTAGWVMLILSWLLTVFQLLAQLAPSGLMVDIMKDTGWSVAATGQLITILTVFTGIFIFFGSPLLDKLGVVKLSFIGILVMGIGSLLSGFAGHSYAAHLIARIILGIGMGAIGNIPPIIIAVWFPLSQQSALQGLRTAIMYLGMALAFYIILPVYHAVGSWQWTFGVFGFIFIVLAVLFIIFGREKKAEAPPATADASSVKQESGLKQAAKRKETWAVTIALLFVLWSFYTYNSFFPTFLQQIRGLDATVASSYAGLMPIAGIISGVVCGAIASATGLRKIVGWPLITLMFIGYMGATLLDPAANNIAVLICIFIGGFGASGFTIYYCTVPAEWEGSNQSLVGGALAIMLSIGTFVTFLIPIIFQILTDAFSMQTAMVGAHLPLIISIIILMLLKETGPNAKWRKKLAENANSELKSAL